MGYHDRDLPPAPEPAETPERGGAAITIGVRLLGVGLLLAGIFVGVTVFVEAWRLYAEPARIERFAQAVEAGSHIDAALAPPPRTEAAPRADLPGAAPPAPPAPAPEQAPLRLSYFLAWAIVLFLLLLIARLAVAAVRAGGELALQDTQVRRLARALIRESLRANRGPG